MEAYTNALLIAIPSFSFLVLLEITYGHLKGFQTYTFTDTLTSMTSGITQTIKNSLGLIVVLISYPFLLEKISIFSLPNNYWIWITAFICIDFAQYWIHRLKHTINIFWNIHVIHHSSEEFNLACALRQSISNLIGFTALFLIPAAIIGIPYKLISILTPLHLFAQFWYHTRHIGKLGFLEYFIVTPSQHRVHHAINPEYIDKNLSAIFCIWDRIFGTFQEELDDVEPVYGVLKPVQTWNPFWINFQHLWRLTKDAFHTKDWKAKFYIWFKPTGWRPEDVKEKYPIQIITDVYSREKYVTKEKIENKLWAIFQFIGINFLLYYFLTFFSDLSPINRLEIGAIIMTSIFGFTSVMDGLKWSKSFEFLRCSSALIYFTLPYKWDLYESSSQIFLYFIVIYLSLTLISLFFISLPEKLMYAKG
ncbi:MAG: sterol desaturase family protein [Flavobacteriaceae bacterium]|nr:sterol desaturase family protein [Flavobacteriaceae bacterium]